MDKIKWLNLHPVKVNQSILNKHRSYRKSSTRVYFTKEDITGVIQKSRKKFHRKINIAFRTDFLNFKMF